MTRRLEEARSALAAHRAELDARPPGLFDSPVEEAVASVETNASGQWVAHTLGAIRRAAVAHLEITVDDVWPHITEPVHDPRALGPVMRRAGREGIIRRLPGVYRTSSRRETHGRPLAVWRSLIHREATGAA